MKSINTIINEIKADANKKIIDSIWDRVSQINSALDDACGSALGVHYGSALTCAGEAVDAYMELVTLCKKTTEQPMREHLRDALGSVKWEKFELPTSMMKAIEKARDEAANPGIARMSANYYTPFATTDPVKEIGAFCNKIVKDLYNDFDGNTDIQFNKPYIKLYEKVTMFPSCEEKIRWIAFDSMDDLGEFLNK